MLVTLGLSSDKIGRMLLSLSDEVLPRALDMPLEVDPDELRADEERRRSSILLSSISISILPRKIHPSLRMTLGDWISPSMEPQARSSTRSEALMFPLTEPAITMLFVVIWAFTSPSTAT